MAIKVKDALGATRDVATVLSGGEEHQIFAPYQKNRSDAFAAPGNGVTVDVSLIPCNRFALQVKGTGAAPTSWEVVIEGSLNGAQFTTIATHKSGVDADGAMRWQGQPASSKYFRSRVVEVTLGAATDIVVNILGEAGA